MGILRALDALPGFVARSPAGFWSVLARSLGEQGGADRTALAWRWALTGACPSPVTLTAAAGRLPELAAVVAEAQAPAELARPDADPGDQVLQARLVLEWMTGRIDALPLRNIAVTGRRAPSAPFARDGAAVAAAFSWALLARYRYSRGDGPAQAGGRRAFGWAFGALDVLGWAGGAGGPGPFSGPDRPAGGGPSLHELSLEVGGGMTGIRLAREARDLTRVRRCEAAMETFLWLAGWNAEPPADRHGHGPFEDCPERSAECGCDAAGRCLGAGCPACARARCVLGFAADKLGSPLAG
jgi:hypothetical protein